MRFLDGDVFMTDVNHEQAIRNTSHVLDAAETALQLVHFTFQLQFFFFHQMVKATALKHLL